VVLIEQSGISRQIVHKKSLIGCIATTLWRQTNAIDDTTGISIDDKDWLVSSIQYYRIGGLLPNAMERKKLLTKEVGITGKQRTKVVIIVFPKPAGKSLKL